MAELKINKWEKILILSPHPDDESIGCGGFLLKYAAQCDVILLTDGARGGGGWSENKTRIVRKNEFQNAMKYLRVHQYEMFGIPDLTLAEHLSYLEKIPYEKYAYVLVPNLFETHKDHCVIFPKVEKIIKRKRLNTKILQYEVWTPLLKPTHYIDISGYVAEKQKLIQFYQCPLRKVDYDKRSIALAYYRGLVYNCAYAECYQISYYPLNFKEKFGKTLRLIKNISRYRT